MRGAAPSNSLKAAYCAVAVECTTSARRRGAEDFADAVKRIWKARIVDIERSEAAVGLVSEKLIEWAKRMERCALSGGGGEELFGRDIEEGMRLVRHYLNEATEEMGPSFLEIAAAVLKENRMNSSGSDQCVGKLEAKRKILEDDGIGEQSENLGDVCMWGLKEDGVLGRSKVLEDVSMKDMEDDGIREESMGLGDASKEGDGCYSAEGFQLESVVEVGVGEGYVNLGDHDMSDPGRNLIHKLDPSEVSKVKEDLKNDLLDLQMMVEDQQPEGEIAAAAAALISISSGNVSCSGPAKLSSRGNGVSPDPGIELVSQVSSGLDAGTNALVKEKCKPDIVNRDPSNSKHLEENAIVEGCNKDAEPSKRNDILVHHALFGRNPTGQTSESNDYSLQSRYVKSSSANSRRISLPRLDDRRPVKRRAIKRWTLLEENTLREAVDKHGVGNWKLILSYNAEIFEGRTEVDLKDKWRNMSRYLLQV